MYAHAYQEAHMKGLPGITCKVAIVLLGLLIQMNAQISGSVAGTVRDASGAVVPNASLTVTNNGTNLTYNTTSNQSGDFQFLLLPVGGYSLRAIAPGFSNADLKNVMVALGQATRADVVLRVGTVATEVEVSGTVAALQTESATISGVVRHEDIVNLPLNGRNFVQLVALQPNAVPSPRTSFFRNLGGYNVIAGAPVEATAVTIDGVNIRDLNDPRINISLNPDVIQEFQEAQSTYSANQGLGGGAQVNLVTRSGTNSFHGSLFEFVRNEKLDASNYFATQKPPYKQNQFGGSLGGPIIKNKTFFFAGYEGLRIVKKETFRYTVPTLAQRSGNFSGGPAIYDPFSVDPTTGLRRPFAGNIIPSGRFSPQSVKALQLLYPVPNQPGNVNNLVGFPPDNSTNDQFSVRIDHRITDNNSLFGRYIYYNYRRKTGIFSNLPNFGDNFNTPSQNAAIGFIHVFSPQTLNQFRVGFHRMTQVIEDFDIKVPINDQIGITGTSTIFLGNPTISIAGLNRTAPIGNAPNDRSDNGYYTYDDFSHSVGRHTLNMGGNLVFEQINGGINSNARGSFSFRPNYTAQLNATQTGTVAGTGQAVADFLLGYVSNSARGLGIGFRNFRQRRVGLYLNDDWRAKDNLTLNLGLRWEYFGPAFEAHDHLSGFDPGTGTIILAGQNGVPRGLRKQNWTDFQPRIGIAWHMPDQKMVVRTGWGVYFMPMTTFPSPFLNLLNEPFFTSQSFFGTPLVPNLTLANAFPSVGGIASTSLNSINRNFQDPYLQQWNLSVGRELASDLTLEVAYVGNRGFKLRNQQNINAPVAGPGVLQSKRPFPAFSTITSYENIGNSYYHSGYVKVDKRFAHGLTFTASYTLAKLLDTGGIVQPGDLNDALGRNPLRPNDERGRSYFDARHRFVGSYVWEIPVGQGKWVGTNWSGPLNQVLGNWQVNGILTLQTGLPITPVLATDNSNTGLFTDRPDRVGDPNTGPNTVSQWFNTAAFTTPPQYSYGNSGRNIIDGPPIKNFDLSLFKNFVVKEGLNVQFRSEFFNVLNHPNFDPPGTTFGTSSFGVISSAGDPRQIQFALKLLF
jgi:hypothetical protein